jgi:hypothetical protein
LWSGDQSSDMKNGIDTVGRLAQASRLVYVANADFGPGFVQMLNP